MVKQSDIAKKLNISRTTVARALNGKGSIHPETKEKILKLCKELGYTKNPISTSLATKKIKKIYAFIVKTRNINYYTYQLKLGIKRAEEEYKFYKYKIELIETSIDNPKEQIDILKKIVSFGDIDGIIITPLLKKEISDIRKSYPKIKFIALEMKLDDGTLGITYDYYKVGKILANILTSMLNTGDKILIIDTDDDMISSKASFTGFYKCISEKRKYEIIGPVYQKDLKNNVKKVLSENMTKEIKAVYSSRFLIDIIGELLNQNYDLKFVGSGLCDRTIKFIQEEKIVATVAQRYAELAYIASKYMFNALYKDDISSSLDNSLENKIFFKENIDEIFKSK